VQGERLTFEDEARAIYDATPPRHADAHFQKILDELERKLPGEGPLAERYNEWRNGFIIPKEKLDAVFQLAIKACRERTLSQLKLPPEESFTVEYVTGKSWGGYNWYQGNYRSLIQVNTDLPVYIDRAGRPRRTRRLSRPPRLQPAAREESRARPRLGGVHGLPALLAAVAHRRRDGKFRQRDGVPEAGADEVRT
jgi:hypothetical protein